MSDLVGNKFKISVILPVYNVEKYLHRCMDSIISQTMDKNDFEVIMVDDGAKDSSPIICDEYTSKYENFKVIHQMNAGAAAARNAGLAKASGEYVAFVDPDDYIEPDYLEVAYNTAKENLADIALFDAVREKNPSEISLSDTANAEDDIKRGKVELWGHAPSAFVTSDEKDILSMRCQILYPYMRAEVQGIKFNRDIPLSAPWDKCYRRDFLKEKSLMFPKELKVLDDMSFNFVAFGAAEKIAYTPKALYHYCIEPTSITNSYKANRPELDMQVFEYLRKVIDSKLSRNKRGNPETLRTYNEGEMAQAECKKENSCLYQAYYARIIKSFAICCRLCFFNEKNPKSEQERLISVKAYMKKSPYKEAFARVRLNEIDYKLLAVTIAGRLKSSRMLKLLDSFQNRT